MAISYSLALADASQVKVGCNSVMSLPSAGVSSTGTSGVWHPGNSTVNCHVSLHGP